MGHNYLIAAFICTWVIQLGYLGSVLLRWQGQKSKRQN
jgi:hypothetical protein